MYVGGSEKCISNNGIVFSVGIYSDNNNVCNRCQRRININSWYANERRLKDDLRCRTLEITSYCHPIATFDIMQKLFSVSSRIKDWSAARWKDSHKILLQSMLKKILSYCQKSTYKIPILSLILVPGPKDQGFVTKILKSGSN